MGRVEKYRDGVRWVENTSTEILPPAQLEAYLSAWVADINSIPFPANTSSAPEATK